MSDGDNTTVTLSFVQLFDDPLTPVTGGVRSTLTGTLDAVVVFPALSAIEALVVSALPSPVIRPLAGCVDGSIPDSASTPDHPIATSPLYQPFPLADVVGVPVRVGAVLSMLMPETPALAELSALSTAVPATDWFAPSVESTTVPPPVQDLMPESASAQMSETVTLELFQPAAFAAGAALPVMVGFALSSLTTAAPVPLLPSLSVAVAFFVTPEVLVFAFTLSEAGVGPEPIPEPASVADQARPTLALFQPAAFAAGDRAAVTTGPVLSSVNDACKELVWPVHFPCGLTLGEADTVTAWAPSPAPAVVVKVQLVLVATDWSCAVNAPATSTHLVSLLVTTVRVSAPPCFAYVVPPDETVPVPPVKVALVTLDPKAGAALSIAATTAPDAITESQPRVRPSRIRTRLVELPLEARMKTSGDCDARVRHLCPPEVCCVEKTSSIPRSWG
ncbi:hypothetical protein J7E25_03765 [Agromyces sp. ISL-38]|uniref:hypothetical protein n=1 Tax=Agromyces sp. ISL-38 TaxID=2819107 RepID=UPI001BECB914|nr:hypothetical protein [Agromyces sp. ISL-38]MBT2498202.1 hypothetical protein [Agromyces sp. ISL-38]MBT2518648.1 hypothetical protein [Streptomyces sp. ISL-90]